MRNGNHAKAFIAFPAKDKDRRAWAKEYYQRFRFEKSSDSDAFNDKFVDSVVDLVGTGSADVTLVGLLRAIVTANEEGFEEIIIVCHGNLQGLGIALIPGSKTNAERSSLEILSKVANATKERDRIGKVSSPAAQLTAWKTLLNSLSWVKTGPQAIADLSTPSEASDFFDTYGFPQLDGKPVNANKDIMELVRLRNKVVDLKLQDVEIRACEIGRNIDAMKALREFLGALQLVAPMVKGFYARVAPNIFTTAATYDKALRADVLTTAYNSKPLPTNPYRYYLQDKTTHLNASAPAGTDFALRVSTIPGKQTACATLGSSASDFSAVQSFVNHFLPVMLNSPAYMSGSFPIGGLHVPPDIPMPPKARGKSFILPGEDEFRDLLVLVNAKTP